MILVREGAQPRSSRLGGSAARASAERSEFRSDWGFMFGGRLGGRAAPAEFQFVPLARSKSDRQSFLTAAELLWADGVASSSVGRMAQLKYAISLGYAALGVRVGPLPKSQLSFASHATSARAIAPRLTRRPPRMRAQEGGASSERTCSFAPRMSASDPKRTSASQSDSL